MRECRRRAGPARERPPEPRGPGSAAVSPGPRAKETPAGPAPPSGPNALPSGRRERPRAFPSRAPGRAVLGEPAPAQRGRGRAKGSSSAAGGPVAPEPPPGQGLPRSRKKCPFPETTALDSSGPLAGRLKSRPGAQPSVSPSSFQALLEVHSPSGTFSTSIQSPVITSWKSNHCCGEHKRGLPGSTGATRARPAGLGLRQGAHALETTRPPLGQFLGPGVDYCPNQTEPCGAIFPPIAPLGASPSPSRISGAAGVALPGPAGAGGLQTTPREGRVCTGPTSGQVL